MRQLRRATCLTALAAAAAYLTLTACSHGSTGAGGATAPHGGTTATATGAASMQQITVHTTDKLRFEPATIAVHQGTVQITLVNEGSYPHNISVPDLHVTSATVSGSPGQQSTTTTFTFNHPGTYRFVCTFHASAGMRGQIVVT